MTRLPEVLRELPDPSEDVVDGTGPTAPGGMAALQEALGFQFDDPALLRVALTLGSWANEHPDSGWPSNACLEFFGDAVLNLVVADALWQRFPTLAEGELTRLRATLVAERALVEIAETLELGDYLWLGKGDLKRGGRTHPSTLADAVEAVLGAVFLDARESGRAPLRTAAEVVERWLGDRIQDLDPAHGLDPKSRLQHWAQAHYRVTPTYVRVGEKPPPGQPHWRAQVQLQFPDGVTRVLGTGEGRSLRAAERRAAEQALHELGVQR